MHQLIYLIQIISSIKTIKKYISIPVNANFRIRCDSYYMHKLIMSLNKENNSIPLTKKPECQIHYIAFPNYSKFFHYFLHFSRKLYFHSITASICYIRSIHNLHLSQQCFCHCSRFVFWDCKLIVHSTLFL